MYGDGGSARGSLAPVVARGRTQVTVEEDGSGRSTTRTVSGLTWPMNRRRLRRRKERTTI
jgi:hypothetical protein